MVEVGWQLFADESCLVTLAQGVFPAQWFRGDGAQVCEGDGDVRLSTLHPQTAPVIHQEARKLLKVPGLETRQSAFTVKKSALQLHATPVTSQDDMLYCVLTTKSPHAPLGTDKSAVLYESWFEAKLHRAEMYRQRGNERFKNEEIKSAIRAYGKALQWLACPSSRCSFSHEELTKANTVAIACHSNLATCHWKLTKMIACIRHCTQALALDASHTKARYRRSQAYLNTKNVDQAVVDLEQLVANDPGNKFFRTSLDRARLTRQQQHGKEKQAFMAMFSG